MSTIDVLVPDIGDFSDVPVIEVLVKPGDRVEKESPLVTLESEKASMEVPSPEAGVVQDLAVKVGDKVSKGSALLRLTAEAAASASPKGAPTAESPRPATEPADFEVTVPDIGDFSDVPVIEVLVKPGDRVEKESPLVTLESEKASMEVPSPRAGVVQRVAVKVGDKVSRGSALVTLATPDAATPASPAAAQPAAPQPAAAPQAPAAAAVTAASRPQAPPASDGPAPATNGSVHAGPAIRRFARELGVELRRVKGSGPNGRITREDVQSFVKAALRDDGRAAAGKALPFDLPPWPKTDFAQYGPIETKPLGRIKKISGPNLARNWIMIPHVTNHDDADITDLEEFRKSTNAEHPQAKVTILAFLMKAAVAALQHYPDVNSSLEGENLVLKRYYHIGFAADTPNGLLVPVVRNADVKGVLELAAETRDLAAKAREGKLSLAEMSGASFTISSLGGIGGTGFTPIINAPEVAILGASRAAMRPCWDGKEFVPRLILPLSLSYDHRVIDGAQAARFLAFLAGVLGDMRRAML